MFRGTALAQHSASPPAAQRALLVSVTARRVPKDDTISCMLAALPVP